MVPGEENVPQRAQHDGFGPVIVPVGKHRRHSDSRNPGTLLPQQLPANPDARTQKEVVGTQGTSSIGTTVSLSVFTLMLTVSEGTDTMISKKF